ncbi:hypothetical protein Z517_11962 [Fonsecaea pedrosoi CBS 271.37]|uniref:Metallo-beta-lactamase domain-containing protein n=1 Tax=Fonsecaea pedrosoi CBS 271.37 TaxID=1442368 RepID=A0A0D2GRV3_9EURO|nr:uncharacterized protein Z517_11962 [Fonsecaea pedrosoi CBS 271.37]KIW75189.1 hypothetical protein Z517_11962 [Fonsecaea pedrosoi CBS 271.37]
MAAAHNFDVPAGNTVRVRIIDTTSRIEKVPSTFLMEPIVPGFTHMPKLPSWSFLVEHASGKKALFDLGVPPTWKDFSPVTTSHTIAAGWNVTAEKHTVQILEETGIKGEEISSIIWSHWHWDHLGDPSTFPPSTELVVGPGFKEAFFPGYPAKIDAPVRESDFAGREVREIDFTESKLKIEKFDAFDFFGDGSFYLLDTPGHAIGHLCGLARTSSNPDTFIMMGGDLCHHSGELRPSPLLPLPQDSQLQTILQGIMPHVPACPGAVLEHVQHSRGRKLDEPFFIPAMGLHIPTAIESIKKAQEADADSNVWFIFAHDDSLWGLIDFFPADVNSWKEKGWGAKTKWSFLKDFRPALEAEAETKS